MKFSQKRKPAESDEFLWLMSLSDLMILLFIFFVVMFSFTQGKLQQSDMQRIVASLRNEADPLDAIQVKLSDWAKELNLTEQIGVRKTRDAVVLEIKDNVLFESGDYVPHISGAALIHKLSNALEKIPAPYQIGIEGHTDDTPIHSAHITSNWELSARRAISVLETMSLPDATLKRTVLIARGQMEPLVPNRDAKGFPIPANQRQNRRVTIRIF